MSDTFTLRDVADEYDDQMDALRERIEHLTAERDSINSQFLALQAMHAKVCGKFATDRAVMLDTRASDYIVIHHLKLELDGLRDELRVAEGDAAEWRRRYDRLLATRVPMERVEGGDGLWREVRT